jgi:hypothetical protein
MYFVCSEFISEYRVRASAVDTMSSLHQCNLTATLLSLVQVCSLSSNLAVRAGKGRTARAQDQNPANTDDMPSLHDLANMHISGNDAGEREDPLAAFESLQRTGGAIRVRRDFVAESKVCLNFKRPLSDY